MSKLAIFRQSPVSSTAITHARKKVPEVDFFVHDLVTEPALPFQSGSLDLIVMVEVVWYVLPVLSDVFSEFARLLTPGGRGAQASLLSAR